MWTLSHSPSNYGAGARNCIFHIKTLENIQVCLCHWFYSNAIFMFCKIVYFCLRFQYFQCRLYATRGASCQSLSNTIKLIEPATPSWRLYNYIGIQQGFHGYSTTVTSCQSYLPLHINLYCIQLEIIQVEIARLLTHHCPEIMLILMS